MTPIPEGTMRKARKLACIGAADFDAHVNAIAEALHAARQDQIRKDVEIAREAQRMREQLFAENEASINAHRAMQAMEIATAIETQGDEK